MVCGDCHSCTARGLVDNEEQTLRSRCSVDFDVIAALICTALTLTSECERANRPPRRNSTAFAASLRGALVLRLILCVVFIAATLPFPPALLPSHLDVQP